MTSSPARLSVVVASHGSLAALRRTLAAVVAQPEVAEVVVSDSSAADPRPALQAEFPGVDFLYSPAPMRLPALRWAALGRTSGELVGALEARCPPAPGWAAATVAAHAAHPEAAAVGGPVALAAGADGLATGLYWCEYGAFAPPLAPGPAEALSAANVSYKREALEEQADLLAAGAWDTLFFARWRRAGRPMRLGLAEVQFHNTMGWREAAGQRFAYGRDYAAERARLEWGAGSRAKTLAYAALCPTLPALLTARTAAQARRAGRLGEYARALGVAAALQAAWSAGEAAGYLLGADPEARIR